jgi:hypothetical protein
VHNRIDVGGSMFIHAFGAYFGLAVSRMMKPTKELDTTNEGATKTSDLFAMIGKFKCKDIKYENLLQKTCFYFTILFLSYFLELFSPFCT